MGNGKPRGAASMRMARRGETQTARQPKPLSATQRKTLATQQIMNAVGPDKETALTATLEAVSERLAWDSALHQTIRQKYEELGALRASTSKATGSAAPRTARATGPARATSLERLNPYHLLQDYGPEGLRERLQGTTQRRLRTGVDMVQAQNPGTKPASRTRLEDMIDYIVEQLAGPGY